MNITIERLMQKIGHLTIAQELLFEEVTKIKEAFKAEIAKLESEGKTDVTEVLTRLKALL